MYDGLHSVTHQSKKQRAKSDCRNACPAQNGGELHGQPSMGGGSGGGDRSGCSSVDFASFRPFDESFR